MKQIPVLFLCILTVFLSAEDFSLGIDAPQRLANPSRERLCLNGLWRFLPLVDGRKLSDTPPPSGSGWGYFKVPGVWPHGAGNTSFKPLIAPELLKTSPK